MIRVERLGIVMEPEPGNPEEALGVLNPAVARAPDGTLWLFPRRVATGNFSRIGRARVRFDVQGNPVGVERSGNVLVPEADYEHNRLTGGGCEDPRVTYLPALRRYVMAYVAFGPDGPRVALAASDDLESWRRLGLLHFAHARADFSAFGNKDASFFPEPVLDPSGKPAFAILHRPTYRHHYPDGSERFEPPPHIEDPRESIWISYVNLDRAMREESGLTHVHDNHLLMSPEAVWESVKLGGGAPPVAVPQGWLVVYHGIRPLTLPDGSSAPRGVYCAGVAILDRMRPWHILYRSPEPILEPKLTPELVGVVPNVVFPTGLDRRQDLGTGVFDVYYGVADTRIAAARLWIPDALPLHLRRQHNRHPHAQAARADASHPDPPKLLPPT